MTKRHALNAHHSTPAAPCRSGDLGQRPGFRPSARPGRPLSNAQLPQHEREHQWPCRLHRAACRQHGITCRDLRRAQPRGRFTPFTVLLCGAYARLDEARVWQDLRMSLARAQAPVRRLSWHRPRRPPSSRWSHCSSRSAAPPLPLPATAISVTSRANTKRTALQRSRAQKPVHLRSATRAGGAGATTFGAAQVGRSHSQ